MLPCWTDEYQKKFFCEEPIFCFDPNDKRNEPAHGSHDHVQSLWLKFPEKLRKQFMDALSTERIADTKPRVTETEWLRTLIQVRNEIIRCPFCGQDFFSEVSGQTSCAACGEKVIIPVTLYVQKYAIPLLPNVQLFLCHTSDGNEDFHTVTAAVVTNPKNPAILGLANKSDYGWYVPDADGNPKTIAPGHTVPLQHGRTIHFGSATKATVEEPWSKRQ